MKSFLISILVAIGSFFGIHSSQSTNTQVIQGQPIPPLFQDYTIVFNGGTSTATDLTAINYRFAHTYIKNKSTGEETSLPFVSYYEGGWPGLFENGKAVVMGDTLYAPIFHMSADNKTVLNTNLWKVTLGGTVPTLLSDNVGWFAVSDYGYVALSDENDQNLTILDAKGNVVKTINFAQIGYCYLPGVDSLADGDAWSEHTIWVVCDGSGPTGGSIYLKINADTFQWTIDATPPQGLYW